MDGEIARLEDRLERGLGDLKDTLVRIEAKLDAKQEKFDDRLRAVENRLYWFTGIGTAIGALVGIALRKLGL